MKSYSLYSEEFYDRLPQHIKDSDVLKLTSKKVLAALLELLLHSKAKQTKVIYCSCARLRQLSGVGMNELQKAVFQLMDYDLITREVGDRHQGGKATAYTINFQKLKEPIVEKTFDDFFGEFMETPKPSETPNSNVNINTITNTTINTNIKSNINIKPNSKTISILNKKSIEDIKELEQPSTVTTSTDDVEEVLASIPQVDDDKSYDSFFNKKEENENEQLPSPSRPKTFQLKDVNDYFQARVSNLKVNSLKQLYSAQADLNSELNGYHFKMLTNHYNAAQSRLNKLIRDKEYALKQCASI